MPAKIFDTNGRVVMEELLKTSTSYTWADILATKSSAAWFEDLKTYIPREVQAVFGNVLPPSLAELRSLAYHPDVAGAYGDILSSRSRRGRSHLYLGMSSHRPVHTRRLDHDNPVALKKYPNSPYYKLKHINNDYSSRFVTFARIPTDDARLDKSEIGHRRMMCRLAEAFFTVWTMATSSDHRLGGDLGRASGLAFGRMYGEDVEVEWDGLASHSPLKEQIGQADRRVVVKTRYEEAMERLAGLYGGAQFIPDEMEALARIRSKTDQLNQRKLRDDREKRKAEEDPEGVAAAKKSTNEALRESRANETAEKKEIKSEYHQAYHLNREAAMTTAEKDADKLDKAAASRKCRVSKAFAAGILTKQQFDYAEANAWKSQPSWPKAWSRAPSKKAGKK